MEENLVYEMFFKMSQGYKNKLEGRTLAMPELDFEWDT